MVNVESIGGNLIVQHYRPVRAERSRTEMYSAASKVFLLHLVPVVASVRWTLELAPTTASSSELTCTVHVDLHPVLGVMARLMAEGCPRTTRQRGDQRLRRGHQPQASPTRSNMTSFTEPHADPIGSNTSVAGPRLTGRPRSRRTLSVRRCVAYDDRRRSAHDRHRRRLRRTAGRSALRKAAVRVTLIDRHNCQTIQPFLYQVATAGLNVADVTFPIRGAIRRCTNCSFRRAIITSVDHDRRIVYLEDGAELSLDYLIVGGGAHTAYFDVPGAEEHALTLYSLTDARACEPRPSLRRTRRRRPGS